MSKKLGRGLSALIPDYNAISESVQDLSSLRDISVSSISQNKYQPRLLFKDDSLHELAESIRSNGLIQPIVVRPLPAGKYELISGERRFRAVQSLGYETIPAIIKNDVSDQKSMLLSLIENIQREDISAIEQAMAYKQILEHHQLTQQELAAMVGKNRSTIANTLRLLELSSTVKQAIMDSLVSEGHARILLRFSEHEQDDLLKTILTKNLSVRDLESLSQNKTAPTKLPSKKGIMETLSDSCFRAHLVQNGERGKVVVHFRNEKERQDILSRLR